MEEISKSPWGEVGRGAVVAAPKTHPAWLANAAVNNPGATAVGTAAATGAAAQAPKFDKKRSPKKEKAADVATGAALGAGVGVAADKGAFYALKNEYKKSKYNGGTKAQRRAVKAVKAEAAAKYPDKPRKQMHHLNANYPKGAPGGTYRRLSTKVGGGKSTAIAAGLAGAAGAGIALARNKKETVKKMADHADSPFLISKAKKKSPSAGRYATAAAAPLGIHGFVAGKKGHKLKAGGAELLAGEGGGIIGTAIAGPLGGLAAGAGGRMLATNAAHKAGWLKPQKVSKAMTPRERDRVSDYAQTGAVGGAIGGGAAGYKGVKLRNKTAGSGEAGYNLARDLGSSKPKALGNAAKTTLAAARGPKGPVTLGALGAGYLGVLGGTAIGTSQGQRLARKKNRKLRGERD